MNDTQVMDLPDGRELAWLEMGDPAGKAIFGFHGTPGSRLSVALDEAPAVAAGVRLICMDRPGYGHSTYRPGRRLVDWPDDVAAAADHLGIDRFGVVGISGGGPHALVCGALLPGRVTVVGVVSGIGPVEEAGTEEGMMPLNVMITRVSRRWPAPVRIMMSAASAVQRRWPDRLVDLLARQMPPADAEIFARPEVRDRFATDFKLASATTAKAATQDFTIFCRDWGFRLEDIHVPVHLWQGDADRNVPPAHAQRQADSIPGAILHEVPGAGHLLAVDHMGEILQTLAANVG